MAAAGEVEKAAKRAKAVQTELEAAEQGGEGRAEARRLVQEVGRKAKKQYKTHKAWKTQEGRRRRGSTTALEKKAALETEKAALKATLKAQTEILEHSQGIIPKAASGLKSKAGALDGQGARDLGRQVHREEARSTRSRSSTCSRSRGTSSRSAACSASSGTARSSASAATAATARARRARRAQAAATPRRRRTRAAGRRRRRTRAAAPAATRTPRAPAAPARSPTSWSPDRPARRPTAARRAGPPTRPAAPVLPPAPPLHAGAQSVAEALKNGGIQLDKDQVWQLEDVIPKDFTADQMKELLKRLEAMKGGTGAQDPYELIGNIQAEVEKVRRGHDTESELTWVDGEFSEVLSTGAPADVLKKEAAAEEAKDQPPPAGGTATGTRDRPKATKRRTAAGDKDAEAAAQEGLQGRQGAHEPDADAAGGLPDVRRQGEQVRLGAGRPRQGHRHVLQPVRRARGRDPARGDATSRSPAT